MGLLHMELQKYMSDVFSKISDKETSQHTSVKPTPVPPHLLQCLRMTPTQ